MFYYEVRLRRTGELVAEGTVEQCDAIMGWPKQRTYNLFKSPEPKAKRTRNAKYSVSRRVADVPTKQSFYYAVYLRKNDMLIASGTARQCATAMGRSKNSFHCMVSRVESGKNKKFEIYKELYFSQEENI